ncbi:M14 family zinc carboxypeptidase [Methyloprofundus sp.]|uniref:M14 family zinc carboxypeptidase n=1 Tax=Methyloprofundus sp. TaxID=2020875 RepID=UPI003D13B15D
MTRSPFPDNLTELQQIEAIIQRDHKQLLSCQTLCHVSHLNEALPIYALSLGNQAKDIPSITFIGGIHSLERIGTQVVLAFLETLLERLHWDQCFTDILQRVRINFLPLINPVGMINHTRSNGQGIDLMRNAPVDSIEKTIWLAGGHRISPTLPWYRGKENEPMQREAQVLVNFIQEQVLPSPFSVTLDCHSGFGYHNQIWFPYAKSRIEPIKHLGEVYFLRKLFMQTYPYQNYRFEPQSQHYLTHGDLWDHLYQQSLAHNNIFLPLTLEMVSWRWVRKNPLQLRKSMGLFHPVKQHRVNRVLRGHLVLMEYLLHATLSYQNG